MFFFK